MALRLALGFHLLAESSGLSLVEVRNDFGEVQSRRGGGGSEWPG